VDKDSLYDICLCPCAYLLGGTGSCEFSLVIRYRAFSYRAGALDGKPLSDQYDGSWRVAAGACLESGLFSALDCRFRCNRSEWHWLHVWNPLYATVQILLPVPRYSPSTAALDDLSAGLRHAGRICADAVDVGPASGLLSGHRSR